MLREKRKKEMTFRRFGRILPAKISPHCALWNGEYGEDPHDPSCYQLGPQNKYARDSAYSE